MYIPSNCVLNNLYKGGNVAKYSSEKLHENIIDSDDFKQGEFEDSLRKGFLQIDSDLREGDNTKKIRKIKCACINIRIIDPFYKNETSGCTAIVALLTKDNVLYVVKLKYTPSNSISFILNLYRVMQVILVLSFVLRD